jgi:hypothetical protein
VIIHTIDTISDFQRLDSDAIAADQPVDVRTLQTLHKNHNSLLARRVRRNILTQNFRTGNDGADPTYFGGISPTPTGIVGALIMYPLIFLTPFTISLQFAISARKADTSGDARVYPFAHPIGRPGEILAANAMQVSTTGRVKYTATLNLNRPPSHEGRYMAGLVVDGLIDSSTIKSGAAITSVGPDRFAGTGIGASDIGAVVRIDTDDEIEPRVIRSATATSTTAYLTRPWNKMPIPGTDTFSTYLLQKVGIYDVSIWETRRTEFLPTVQAGDI